MLELDLNISTKIYSFVRRCVYHAGPPNFLQYIHSVHLTLVLWEYWTQSLHSANFHNSHWCHFLYASLISFSILASLRPDCYAKQYWINLKIFLLRHICFTICIVYSQTWVAGCDVHSLRLSPWPILPPPNSVSLNKTQLTLSWGSHLAYLSLGWFPDGFSTQHAFGPNV